jgi:BD-FAE protein
MKVLAGLILAAAAFAGVPPNIASQLVEIGRGVCVPETAKIYRPLHGNPPYLGVTIVRDQSFGPDPKNVLDVFAAEKGGGNRPVLIYVSGGAGNKIQGGENGDVFYDNIMLWAVKNGMTGVNMQRRPGTEWDDPAKDVAKVVEWVHANIAKYKGNPNRVFIWAQSAGNIPVSTYIGHPELYPSFGIGLKGAVLMSPPNFNILPVTPTPPAGGRGGFAQCGGPNAQPQAARGGDGKGGGKGAGKGGGKGGPPQVDPQTQLARSNLPGLLKTRISFFLASAELDPPGMTEFNETLKEQFCKAGHCPTVMVFKDHSHISEVMSPNTADDSVTGPILKWMKSVK